MPSFLSVGFAPTSALITWQLQTSGQFDTYTYWPTHTVQFETELFGTHKFQPNQLDLNSAQPVPFDFVLINIASLKDVERMVKKIVKFVSKQSVVLVNTSDGIGSIQRLVRTHLPKVPVAAFICDFTTRHIPNTQTNQWQVLQWGNTKSPGPQMAVHIEPVAPKLIAPLEQALNACRLTCSRQKSQSSFLALQWERNIFCVFELLSVVFSCASIEKLVADALARPLIEGAVNELLALASLNGVKSLPPTAKFVQNAPLMTRKAPSMFAIPGASRLYYDFYTRSNIPLDLLLLVNIIYAEETKKLRMPYLESIYAVSVRLHQLNHQPGDLFSRSDLEAKQRNLDRESPDHRQEQQAALQEAMAKLEQTEAQAKQRRDELEAQLASREAAIRQEQQNFEQRMQQFRAKEDQLSQREGAMQEQTRRLESRERDLERARAVKPISRAGSSTQLFEMQRRGSDQRLRNGQSPQTPLMSQAQGQGQWQGQPQGQVQGQPQPHGQNQGYAPHAHAHAHAQAPNGAPGLTSPGPRRRPHQGPPISYNTHAQLKSPQQPLLPAELDMISLTQKPRRQSLRTGSMRSSSMTSISAAAGGPHSQSFQLDGIMGIASQDRYSLASKPRNTASISADQLLSSNRPFAHGPGTRAKSYVPPPTSSRAPDFSNFNYSYQEKPESAESYSGNSGNSRSTPPRSPSDTPPTPNPLDMKV